jgi:hypothetical protein
MYPICKRRLPISQLGSYVHVLTRRLFLPLPSSSRRHRKTLSCCGKFSPAHLDPSTSVLVWFVPVSSLVRNSDLRRQCALVLGLARFPIAVNSPQADWKIAKLALRSGHEVGVPDPPKTLRNELTLISDYSFSRSFEAL